MTFKSPEFQAGALAAQEVLKEEIKKITKQVEAAKRANPGSDLNTLFNGVEMIMSSLTVAFDNELVKMLTGRKRK